MRTLSNDDIDVPPPLSRDDVLRHLEYIRDVTEINRRARAMIGKRTAELVQRGWAEGLSIRQMAKALGVTPQAVRFRIPESDRPLSRPNKEEMEQ